MEHLANALTDKLIDWKIINSEDRDLYAYGFWQGGIYIFNYASVFLIGLLFGMLWQSVVFILSYGLIRPVAGGYHARTQRNCYLFSVLLIVIVLSMLKWFPLSSIVCILVLLFSGAVIFILAPVEDENKPLDETEQMVYRHRSRIVLSVLSALTLLFLVTGLVPIANNITLSLLVSAIMLILGIIKNKRGRKTEY
ncbi:accessory gene regulator [Lacrimispora amygdalina]|uniref:Accessory gene regulator n=1 Tax=Lacrimispora amygdalina TaxID=253257 RepID=A0ABQ5MB61_9FIRM|nr:accessory gene regulator B family protein [uncultured Clostridium sp.]